MCCKWGYHWKICRFTLRDIYDIPIYFFCPNFFEITTETWLHHAYIKGAGTIQFCEVFEATKKDNVKSKISVFLLLHRYKLNYNSRNNNCLKTCNYLCNEHFKNWENVPFSMLLLKSIINWYILYNNIHIYMHIYIYIYKW